MLLYTLLGLAVGSFLNVCIYRLPRNESVIFPGSRCPHCGNAIRLVDNIPVLSFLLLRGKCRSCGARISLRYPAVELLAAMAFLACALKWDFEPPTYANSLLLSVVLILIFVDYGHRILPNVLTLPGTAAGILLSPLQSRSFYQDPVSRLAASLLWPGNPDALLPYVGAVLGAVAGAGFLLVVAVGYEKLRRRQGLGMGDVKMMAMAGAFLGWPLVLFAISVGSVLCLAVGIFLIIFRGMTLQTKMAFGVFLGMGTAVSLFYGPQFFSWWLNIGR